MKVNITNLLAFLFLLAIVTSCEENDICLEGKTPQLILKLHSLSNPEQKLDSLYVFKESQEKVFLPVVEGIGKDSISIPLSMEPSTQTRLIFTTRKNSPHQNADTIVLHYDYQQVFTSKACGFRVVYKNLNVELNSNHFIKSFNILRNEITDQTTAHILLNY